MASPNPVAKPRPVALITGAAIRIGAAIARELHGAGYDLALHYRSSADAMHALCAELEQARPGSTLMLQADLADMAQLAGVVPAAIQRFARLDALVNNASAYMLTPLERATAAQWDALFDANARAPFFLAQAAAPHLARQHGAIVNLTDFYAAHPQPDGIAHAASKAALVAVTRGLAHALGPHVRCNAVAPGAILWPEEGKDEAGKQAILSRTPLDRIGSVEEIARAVRWLITEATFTTGEVLHVDGGRGVV